MESETSCADCGRSRPVSSFTRDKRRRDGAAFSCRNHSRQRLRESTARRSGPSQSRHEQFLHAAAYYVAFHTAQQEIAAELAAKAQSSAASARPGTPPVGSHRRPGARGTTTRSTRRSSGARRRTQAGEADT